MAGTKTPNSPNVAVWNSRIFADTCAGEFIVDATPSVFIGSGASSVLGAKVKITNPYGVVIKPYQSGYDIPAPLTAAYSQNIPTQAGKLQYGVYTVELELTDSDNAKYYVSKQVNVCAYDSDNYPCDKRVRVVANCKAGTVTVSVSEPPPFRGVYSESRTQDWTIDYPTASGLAPLTTTQGNFSLRLFQGVYKIDGAVCATYDMGDNVFIRLTYEATVYKDVKCLLDYTCIWPAIKKLNDKISTNCSQKDKETYSSIILDALRLLKTAELANDAGEDASEYISELEKLLGCTCMCDCTGSPIMNNSPATSVVIDGCLVSYVDVGLTRVYSIGAKTYYLTVDDTQSIITVSDPSEYGCTSYQQLNFNVGNAYTALKTQINTLDEYNYWASVINGSLASIDATCLGYDNAGWAALTFSQKITALINKACAGGSCTTFVTNVSTTQSGADVRISFVQNGGYSVDIFVDGELKGTVLSGVNEFLLSGYADGIQHDYRIVPKCSNGSNGAVSTGTFGYLACPFISPPVVSSNNVNGEDCPYDLTQLVSAPPAGITVEWHTANNTKSTTLVANPTAVSSGVYYAFAKDADGCFSTSTVVTLICDGATSCTAPQNILVTNNFTGLKISFQSAAFPPPSNSYTVKRRNASDPDVDGSYTTIGTPVFNAGTGKWEISDNTATNETLYTYKAISNCGGSSPSVQYTYANIVCPILTLTPDDNSIDYSFVGSGGQIDKYEVSLFDASGATLLSTQTIVPAFSSPITGTFLYLTSGTTYNVRIKAFIGTYSKTCPLVPATVTNADTISAGAFMNLANPSMSGTIVITTPGGRTVRFSNFSICGLSNASVTISGGIGTISNNISSGTPNDDENVDTLLPVGTYTFTGTLSAGCTSAAGLTLV